MSSRCSVAQAIFQQPQQRRELFRIHLAGRWDHWICTSGCHHRAGATGEDAVLKNLGVLFVGVPTIRALVNGILGPY